MSSKFKLQMFFILAFFCSMSWTAQVNAQPSSLQASYDIQTRVHSVVIVPEGLPEDLGIQKLNNRDSAQLWDKLKRKLRSLVNIHSGDILSIDRVMESKRAIQDYLADQDFVGVKVDELRVNAPQDNAPVVIEPSSQEHWIVLEFHVSFSERVQFGFRGNSFFTLGYLDGLVEELRTVGLGKDYLRVVKAKIEDEYKAAGFGRVDVSWYSIEGSAKEGRKITFVIREGPRVKIDSIDFDGNFAFSDEILHKELLARASSLIQNGIYVEKDFQKAAELLIEKLKEKGYLSAKLIATNSFYVPKPRTQSSTSSVKLLVYLYEGEQTIVQSISLEGVTILPTEDVTRILNVQSGKPLNLYSLGDGIENLKRVYRNQGYLGFRILNEGTVDGSQGLIEYSQENKSANIHLNISEGVQYRVSRIEIEGLEKTKEEVIKRELEFHEGQVLTDNQLIESERNLRKLGIFSQIIIRATDDLSSENSKSIHISVHEADRGILTWGPGLRNDLGVRLFGQLAYTNLWGRNHTSLVNLNTNRRFYLYNFAEVQAQFAYIWPWFAGVPGLEFRPVISAGRTQYINFAADTITASAAWEKPLLEHPNLIGTFAYNLERVRQFNALDIANVGQLLIGSVSPKMRVDLRDNPLNPTRGVYSVAWVDYSNGLLGSYSGVEYYRAQFRTDYHLPLFKEVGWYFSFRTGYEQNLSGESGSYIPLIKQFALGGIGSLRGYQEQQLNKQNTKITGNLSYVNYRTQLDFPFAGALRLGLFLDAANLLVDRYSLGALQYGTGAGFHYQTPVGPVNLDWGFKIDPPPGADSYVIHFSVGVI